MARIGVLYDKDIRERVFGVFATNSSEGRYIISLSASPSTIAVGQSTTITATLTLNGNAVQGQTVTFTIGGTTVGTGTTNANGQATYTYQSTVVGTVLIAGTSNNVRSVTSIIVNKISTTTSISASSQSITVSDSVTLSGSVTGATTGTVKIYDGNTFISDVSLSNGSYTKTLSNLSGGTHTYKAVYQADNTHASSQSSTVTVNVHDYSMVLTGTPIIQSGDLSTVMVSLKDNNVGINNASLSYQIKHGTTIIINGTVTTNSSGNASINYTGSGIGDIDVIVSYGSLLQETYKVKDGLFRDTSTNPNNKWWSTATTGSITHDANGITFNNVGTSYSRMHPYTVETFPSTWSEREQAVKFLDTPFIVEFDVKSISNTNVITLDTNSTLYSNDVSPNDRVKLICDGSTGKVYINGVLVDDKSFTFTNTWFALRITSTVELKIDNFVIYSI